MSLRGTTFWLTGLPAAGKSTLGKALAQRLRADGLGVLLLDGDDVRGGLSADLRFTREGRDEQVRRVGEVAVLAGRSELVTVVALVSPYRQARDAVRAAHARAGLRFVEVHVATSLATCEERDPKGLYARARAGALEDVTGVNAPYEPPLRPEVVVFDELMAVEAAVRRVLG